MSHEDWVDARRALLAEEKALTRARDALSRRRRELPWEEVTKDYVFEGAEGARRLADLFDGRSQLIVYHFMFDPSWDAGCPHCSWWADNFDGSPVHLAARDVSFCAISRTPYPQLAAYEKRMGWTFRWLSSAGSDFNYDFGVSFEPSTLSEPVFNYGTLAPGMEDREGISVFARDNQRIFHTYSAYGRGIDMINATYHLIDLTPKGRDEPKGNTQFWVRRRDEYDA